MGRPPKYDWDDKRDICYKLWVVDKLSTPNIVKWFAEHFKLPESEVPSVSQFHQKFRNWNFPGRRDKWTEEEYEKLTARTKELFEQYVTAQDIQKTLKEEGWDLNAYDFRALRKKNGMLMRSMNGYKPLPSNKRPRTESDAVEGATAEEEEQQQLEDEATAEQDTQQTTLPPEEAARRAQRLAELQVQSDELLRTRKRRRRIRGYGPMPADDPSIGPRYGSETSLDECKAFLQLSNETYLELREQFEAICREESIIKMTLCADGQWQAAKDRLTRGSPHLSAILHPLQPDIDRRSNALNCICSDVTKRMRNQARAMTIADASNLLGLNPVESKEVRRRLYEILEADHFTTTLACGKEHLDELRQRWYETSDALQQGIASGDPQKSRAIDVLHRDARKRYCDDQTRKDPDRKQWQKSNHYGPGPGPAKGPNSSTTKRKKASNADVPAESNSQPRNNFPRHGLNFPTPAAWIGRESEMAEFRLTTIADAAPHIDFDLDPLLSETTHGPPWPPQAPQPSRVSNGSGSASASASVAIPAYFRLATCSQVAGNHPRMWLGKLASGATFDALRQAATSKGGAATQMGKVHGVVKNTDGSEDSWLIETDDELGVYLQEAREKATFVVFLMEGSA